MNEIIYHNLDYGNLCQSMYLDAIIDILNKHISDYSIVITIDFNSLPQTKYRKIVFLICEAGARGVMPYTSYSDVVAVFRFYGVEWGYDNKYVFPIPVGYNCISNETRMNRMYPEKKIAERKYDIFYSGWTLSERKVLVNKLEELSTSFNVFSRSNTAFRSGLDIDDYYRCLGDSKICVVPRGNPNGISADTFRYSEACGSGCIIFTTPHPDFWYCHNAPVFYVNNWGELTKEYMDNIMNKDLDAIQNDTLRYYRECLSEEAVANYVLKNIK